MDARPDPPHDADPAAAPRSTAVTDTAAASGTAASRRPRPLIERIGMAAIALVMAALFLTVGVASFVGGEPFLGAMGVVGCLMVLWVGALTLFRG